MNTSEKWRSLGWKHPLWDYIRFYSVVQRQNKKLRDAWIEKLQNQVMEIDAEHFFSVPADHARLFFEYLEEREEDFEYATETLRTENDARAFAENLGAEVASVRTRSADHHQSSASMVAAVSHIAS